MGVAANRQLLGIGRVMGIKAVLLLPPIWNSVLIVVLFCLTGLNLGPASHLCLGVDDPPAAPEYTVDYGGIHRIPWKGSGACDHAFKGFRSRLGGNRSHRKFLLELVSLSPRPP